MLGFNKKRQAPAKPLSSRDIRIHKLKNANQMNQQWIQSIFDDVVEHKSSVVSEPLVSAQETASLTVEPEPAKISKPSAHEFTQTLRKPRR